MDVYELLNRSICRDVTKDVDGKESEKLYSLKQLLDQACGSEPKDRMPGVVRGIVEKYDSQLKRFEKSVPRQELEAFMLQYALEFKIPPAEAVETMKRQPVKYQQSEPAAVATPLAQSAAEQQPIQPPRRSPHDTKQQVNGADKTEATPSPSVTPGKPTSEETPELPEALKNDFQTARNMYPDKEKDIAYLIMTNHKYFKTGLILALIHDKKGKRRDFDTYWPKE